MQTYNLYWFYRLVCRLPFNWKTPVGYPIALIYQIVLAYPSFFHLAPILSFAIGLVRIFIAMIDDISNDLHRLNEMSQQISKTTKNHQQMKTLFAKIINDFSDVKQLSWIFFKYQWLEMTQFWIHFVDAPPNSTIFTSSVSSIYSYGL